MLAVVSFLVKSAVVIPVTFRFSVAELPVMTKIIGGRLVIVLDRDVSRMRRTVWCEDQPFLTAFRTNLCVASASFREDEYIYFVF